MRPRERAHPTTTPTHDCHDTTPATSLGGASRRLVEHFGTNGAHVPNQSRADEQGLYPPRTFDSHDYRRGSRERRLPRLSRSSFTRPSRRGVFLAARVCPAGRASLRTQQQLRRPRHARRQATQRSLHPGHQQQPQRFYPQCDRLRGSKARYVLHHAKHQPSRRAHTLNLLVSKNDQTAKRHPRSPLPPHPASIIS